MTTWILEGWNTDSRYREDVRYMTTVPELTRQERNWLCDQGQAQIEAKFDRLAAMLPTQPGRSGIDARTTPEVSSPEVESDG